jgi:hypothetical protein
VRRSSLRLDAPWKQVGGQQHQKCGCPCSAACLSCSHHLHPYESKLSEPLVGGEKQYVLQEQGHPAMPTYSNVLGTHLCSRKV